MTEADTDASPPGADDRPLFIVGCARSGTTLTRNLLRRVPNFICPEETQFYRWTEAFRTPTSKRAYRHNAVLRHHRELDGVAEEDYRSAPFLSRTKAELQRRYITLYAGALGISGPYRWFDKSPQNIYGAGLIAQEFPQARFLHLVRNPLNVVGSLVSGRQFKIDDTYGACNYWLEAVQLGSTLQAAFPERVLQMRYEDLINDVPARMEEILQFAEVDHPPNLFDRKDARPERNLWRQDLTGREADIVRRRCGPLATALGYDLAALIRENDED